MMQPPECEFETEPETGEVVGVGDCGRPAFAIIYFVTFIVINFMIVINMYIAVILENFNQAHQEEEIGIVEEDLEMFYVRWAKYDPHATQFINFSQLSDFVSSLDPPMGIAKPNTVALVSFDLPIAKGDKIHCLDILHALTKHVLGHVEETDEFKKLQEQMNEKFKKQFPTRKELEIVSSTRQWKQMDLAARVLQRSMKAFVKRKREQTRLALNLDQFQTQTTPGRSPPATPMFLKRVASYLHVPGRRSRAGSLASAGSAGSQSSPASSRRSSCNIGDTFGKMGLVGVQLPGLNIAADLAVGGLQTARAARHDTAQRHTSHRSEARSGEQRSHTGDRRCADDDCSRRMTKQSQAAPSNGDRCNYNQAVSGYRDADRRAHAPPVVSVQQHSDSEEQNSHCHTDQPLSSNRSRNR